MSAAREASPHSSAARVGAKTCSRHMKLARGSVVVLGTCVFVAFVFGAGACEDGPVPEPCTNVPEGGCPLARGLSCMDPTCEAVYLCRPNNVWELYEHCPPHDASAPRATVDATDTREASSIVDASIDAPPGAFGGPGCTSLQSPECALGVALGCGAGCCGCEDLFVCENGGWTLWGVCGDAGPIQQ